MKEESLRVFFSSARRARRWRSAVAARFSECIDRSEIPRRRPRHRQIRARVWRMDLQAFIVRGQVLSLMRKALRAARQAPPESRAEIRAEIRRSFETSRHHDDSRTIKHLLSDGRILVKQLKEMVGLTT